MLAQGYKNIIEEAVEKGAGWMDQHWPNWRENIDTETLMMHDSSLCILGQSSPLVAILYGPGETTTGATFDFLSDLGAAEVGFGNSQRFTMAYGFDLPYEALDEEYGTNPYSYDADEAWNYLQELWIDEIESRRV